MSKANSSVRIVEVGLRDGLQNEKVDLSLDIRYELLEKLIHAGLKYIEAGSFVSPKWVPAMACSEELFAKALSEQKNGQLSQETMLSALVPNEKGMEIASRLGVKEIAIFAACSETFARKNTNCSIEESFTRMLAVTREAQKNGMRIRGYLSTCFGCPFEGPVKLDVVADNVQRMIDLGAYEVSLGDTIGLASAGHVDQLLSVLLKRFDPAILAGHFHDTRGQAAANILRSYQMGLRTFDASIGGLGGCPYAPGATGNVATEDVVYLFDSMGVDTGVKILDLLNINAWLSEKMNKLLPSKVGLASNKNHPSKLGVCFL